MTISSYWVLIKLNGSPNGIPCDNLEHLEKVYTKLGQLEDIEEELGIDLITFYKRLGCNCRDKNNCSIRRVCKMLKLLNNYGINTYDKLKEVLDSKIKEIEE